jgi:peptidoglycan/LPS O-acetylase OafA/YrhL
VSILYYFVSLIFLFILFEFLNKIFGFAHNIEKSKFPQIDGLRAILALSVIYHHSLIMYYYCIIGDWQTPPSKFFAFLGPISVSLFFMITGFLFGFKLFQNEFDLKKFFISRVKRLIPLYVFSVLLLVFVVFYINNFILKEDLTSLFTNILKWLSFKFVHFVPINNDPRVFEIQSVYWTLKWEWKFYFALPFLFLLNKKVFKRKDILFVLFLLVLFFFYRYVYVFIFLLGVLAALLYNQNIKLNKTILNIVGILSLFLVFILFDEVYEKLPAMLLGIFFISIIIGGNLNFILNLRILRYFGTISYSLYLLHNIVIFFIFYNINIYYKSVSIISQIEYWIILFSILIITTLFSMFTYTQIEHRFYKRGKK